MTSLSDDWFNQFDSTSDFYAVLGLPVTATQEQILTRCSLLIQLLHPHNYSDDTETLNTAYQLQTRLVDVACCHFKDRKLREHTLIFIGMKSTGMLCYEPFAIPQTSIARQFMQTIIIAINKIYEQVTELDTVQHMVKAKSIEKQRTDYWLMEIPRDWRDTVQQLVKAKSTEIQAMYEQVVTQLASNQYQIFEQLPFIIEQLHELNAVYSSWERCRIDYRIIQLLLLSEGEIRQPFAQALDYIAQENWNKAFEVLKEVLCDNSPPAYLLHEQKC